MEKTMQKINVEDVIKLEEIADAASEVAGFEVSRVDVLAVLIDNAHKIMLKQQNDNGKGE